MGNINTYIRFISKPQFVVALLVGLFFAMTIGLYILFDSNSDQLTTTKVNNIQYTDEVEPEVEVGEGNPDDFSQYAVKEDSKFSVVFVGYGGAGHSGGTLADTIILLSLDPQAKKAQLISIPRDLWIALPTDYNNQTFNKINAAYAIGLDNVGFPNKRPEFKGNSGGGNMIKYGVYIATGIQVDNFIAIDFSGLGKAIDALGGVAVNVPRTFDDYFYPVKGLENETCGFTSEQIASFHAIYSGFELEKQFVCRYEHIHFDQGQNTMSGSDALKFVRSRHSATYGGDFARSEKQFAVLESIKDKIVALDIINKKGELFNTLVSLVVTDIGINGLEKLVVSLGSFTDYALAKINLSTDNVLVNGKSPQGKFILIPKQGSGDWTGVQNYIKNY